MSAGKYRRATKKHAVLVEHVDGSTSEGSVPVPLGMDFLGMLMQATGFLTFEAEDGALRYLNLAGIKSVTDLAPEEDHAAEEYKSAAEKAKAERQAREAEEREAQARADAEAAENARPKGPQWSAEAYDALEILGLRASASRTDIQSAYRKLVKLYHPDRLRGLGVSQRKIDFAAERLAEINQAYRVLIASPAAAA